MPRMPAYQSRYGDTITELLSRRGDIAAQGAMRSGEIWGSTVAGLGNLAANTYQQYSQEKQQQKSAELQAKAFDDAISTFSPDKPLETYRKLATVYGAEGAMNITKGLQGFSKLQEKPDPKAAMELLPAIAAGIESLPESERAKVWGPMHQLLGASGLDMKDVPTEYDPQTAPTYLEFAKNLNKKDASGTNKVLGPEDVLISPEGKEIARGIGKSPADKAPVTATFGGRVHQLDRATNTWVPLGASEAALGREAALGKEERGREDAAKKAEQAGNETRTQVEAAFAAMETALKEVEKYSGTAAFTSPLEAKNARQQYDDASKAFAATLSRATGDTRISDLDRKAYAGLLAYAGPGAGLLKVARPDLVRKRLEEAKKMFKSASDVGLVGGASGLSESAPSDPLGIRK